MLLIDGIRVFTKVTAILLSGILFQNKVVIHGAGATEATTSTVYGRLILHRSGLAPAIERGRHVLAALAKASIACHVTARDQAYIHRKPIVCRVSISVAT